MPETENNLPRTEPAPQKRGAIQRLLTALSSRSAVTLLTVLACWPVCRWYALRMSDGSDEPWGLVALAAAVLFAPRNGWREAIPRGQLLCMTGLLGLYAATFPHMPALGRALLFVVMLALAAPPKQERFGWSALLILSLPVIATAQFYLGYPLRLATTFLCVPLLRVGGLQVTAEATALRWLGETVIVDAPCSGIHMVWTGLFLAAALACWKRLNGPAAVRLLRWASVLVFTANVLRAAALFCIETKIWPSPSWAHETVGLVLFCGAAIGIVFCSHRPSSAPLPT
jgi:exosortase/archaeosortase family protein